MTQWLANLSWQVVLMVVAVLVAARIVLGRFNSRPAAIIGEAAESLAVALAVVYLVVKPFLIQAFFIPSGSMRPTLLERDHIIVNKLVYRFREPERGDVVVFRAPKDATQDGKEKDFIKRVIGLPGDTLEIHRGFVTVGPRQLDHYELRKYLSVHAPRSDVYVKLRDDGVLVNGRKITDRQVAAAVGEPEARVSVFPGRVFRNGKLLNEPYTAEDPNEDTPFLKVPPGRLFVMGDNRNDSNDSRRWGPLERRRVLGKAMFTFWPVRRIGWIH